MKTFALLLFLTACVAGCGDQSMPECPDCNGLKYPAPRSPYAVIQDLRGLFVNRDVQEFEQVLSSDFVYKFIDPRTRLQDSLIFVEVVTSAEHLFIMQPAASSKLIIDTTSSTPDNRVGHAGWITYVVQTNLTVGPDGMSFSAEGPAVFYFKQEPVNSGTWKLAEWDEQPTSSAALRRGRD